MKRVVLVRHAKAVGFGYDDDFNRDLRSSGILDAKHVGDELKRRGIHPDKMISSPALRALKTAKIFAENFGYDEKNIQKNRAIYDGLTTAEFIEIIKTLPKEAGTAFFFGHNPDLEHFAQGLITKYSLEMPTCAALVIDFDIENWEKAEARTGRLNFRVVPKDLR